MWTIWQTQTFSCPFGRQSISSIQPVPTHLPALRHTQDSATLHFTVHNMTCVDIRHPTSRARTGRTTGRPHPKTSPCPISSPVAVNTQALHWNKYWFIFRDNGLLSLFKLDWVHCLVRVQHSKGPALGLSTDKRGARKRYLFDVTRYTRKDWYKSYCRA